MTAERLNVLFVDDEPRLLDGLRRQLRMRRTEWDMRFAESGAAALAMLAQSQADIVVSDMRMPGMSGGQLLRDIRVRYPQITRMILSGQTDQEDLLKDLGCIHHYLQKPCDAQVICAAIERTHSLSNRLKQPKLRIAANRVIALPPSGAVYETLVEELRKPDADLARVGDIVASDPALTAKLMQLGNSAFFGTPRPATDPRDVVRMLGLQTVGGLIRTARIFDFISQGDQNRMISSLWTVSCRIAEAAGYFAAVASAPAETVAQARLAGLLCLVGRAILFTSEPEAYGQVLNASRVSGASLNDLEMLEFGATQDEVAAYALGKWAFADEIVEAVAWQSRPSRDSGAPVSTLLRCLHMARITHDPTADGLDQRPEADPGLFPRTGIRETESRLERSAA